jgi:hypothetical protein
MRGCCLHLVTHDEKDVGFCVGAHARLNVLVKAGIGSDESAKY